MRKTMIYVPVGLHHALKAYAAKKGKQLGELAADAIGAYLHEHNVNWESSYHLPGEEYKGEENE